MSDEKRKCIFTNLPADSKIIISSSKHSWTKAVPCTKKFKESKTTSKLTDIEFKLVELFIQKELALLKVEFFENKMNEIRELNKKNQPFEFKNEDIEIVNVEFKTTNDLTVFEKNDKIKQAKDIWDDE